MAQSDIDKFASVIPVGRMCTPEDVAGAVAYLVSPDAKFITGVNLQVCLFFSIAIAILSDQDLGGRRKMCVGWF
jgi:NAD(P)-dependent dehydrogenase (short-subunit alcohol dehydrogenase family)